LGADNIVCVDDPREAWSNVSCGAEHGVAVGQVAIEQLGFVSGWRRVAVDRRVVGEAGLHQREPPVASSSKI
jgi:hypothetical protein